MTMNFYVVIFLIIELESEFTSYRGIINIQVERMSSKNEQKETN